MNAIANSAPAIVQLRSACQRALTFFFEGTRATAEQRARDNKNAKAANEVAAQIRYALDFPLSEIDFDELAADVVATPGIEQAIVQKTISLERSIADRIPAGVVFGHAVTTQFRVFLQTDKSHAEATGADLPATIAEAFKLLKERSKK